MGVMDLPGGRRTYAQEMEFLERVTQAQWRVSRSPCFNHE